MSIFKTQRLTKEFVRSGLPFVAVKEVTLEVARGDFLGIAGKSGSGKSTLINMIAGLTPPGGGKVIFGETDIFTLDDGALSAFRNKHIGYVPQGSGLLSNFTVLDNVRMPFFLTKGGQEIPGRARELLELTGIAHLAETYPKELSGGEMKRVAVARALVNRPDIVLADEPTSDLDVATTKQIMELFTSINKEAGQAFILVTHDLDVLAYCGRVCVMSSGVLTEVEGEAKVAESFRLLTR